jgi:hypothetical protein
MSEAKSFREQMASSTLVHVAFGFSPWAPVVRQSRSPSAASAAGLVQAQSRAADALKKFLERLSPALQSGRV